MDPEHTSKTRVPLFGGLGLQFTFQKVNANELLVVTVEFAYKPLAFHVGIALSQVEKFSHFPVPYHWETA